ncbi:MAG: DUF1064 domain-containing protein [Planctomycetia bacterium]|nr:DUF1064 domain-containing protein [Planctomycetia bacterium]
MNKTPFTLPGRIRRNKYNNVKTVVNGHTFASKKEAHRYWELTLLEKQGDIFDLKLQPRFELQPQFEKNGKKYRAIEYRADFCYYEREGKYLTVEDVKGYRKDKVFLLKQKLFEYKFPKLTLVLK